MNMCFLRKTVCVDNLLGKVQRSYAFYRFKEKNIKEIIPLFFIWVLPSYVIFPIHELFPSAIWFKLVQLNIELYVRQNYKL